jgi:hypothetical protein
MKKNMRREYVWEVLEMVVNHFGGHCYIKCYDKDGIAVTTSPILIKDEGDSIIAIVDDFFDQFPDPERIREIVAGDVIEPATVHEYKEGRRRSYINSNYLLEGIKIRIFDQCPYAKRRTIKGVKKEAINIAYQYSENKEYTKYFKKQDDIIIK